uniref:Interferon-induced GTP-binding protein Mx n=1 Tax=Talaromyces marneffei PM1 TaxID=1077442 RepID=A0A093UWQ9_TALMA
MGSINQRNDGQPPDEHARSESDHFIPEALSSLETVEQRQVLDIVSQLRKCGLNSVLSLPQIVVCGDQSAGKSSVLEALLKYPFHGKIIYVQGKSDSLQIRVIPDPERSVEEQKSIREFRENITSFEELPKVMDKATEIMGINKVNGSGIDLRQAFARDVLSVEIEGPNRPQLTVVDLPGIVQSQTKDTSQADVQLTVEITESYISQPRTICLAVISATNDYANQPILNKVRQFDPKGERTLGIITKPDRLHPGSETEDAFLRLAKNEDIYFTLGWHILKNRSYEEAEFSIQERKDSESKFFRQSRCGTLSPAHIGISSLVDRLSKMLFSHVQQALPLLHEELDEALGRINKELAAIREPRASPDECKIFLAQLALNFYEVCKAAVNGHYEDSYFRYNGKGSPLQALALSRRLRAEIQLLNQKFAEDVRQKGHKYHINGLRGVSSDAEQTVPQNVDEVPSESEGETGIKTPGELKSHIKLMLPETMSHRKAMKWVNDASSACQRFLKHALDSMAPRDIFHRLWPRILGDLTTKRQHATDELEKILKDIRSYVINYNHYYTDIIKKSRYERRRAQMQKCIEKATRNKKVSGSKTDQTYTDLDLNHLLSLYSERIDPNMDDHSSEEILDCLFAIYKVNQKIFIANVTIQVIERHVLQGLEEIFCPLIVANISDADAVALALEPAATTKQRDYLSGLVSKIDYREPSPKNGISSIGWDYGTAEECRCSMGGRSLEPDLSQL